MLQKRTSDKRTLGLSKYPFGMTLTKHVQPVGVTPTKTFQITCTAYNEGGGTLAIDGQYYYSYGYEGGVYAWIDNGSVNYIDPITDDQMAIVLREMIPPDYSPTRNGNVITISDALTCEATSPGFAAVEV